MKRLLPVFCLLTVLISLNCGRADTSTDLKNPVWVTIYVPMKNSKLESRRVKTDLDSGKMPTNQHFYQVEVTRALPALFIQSRSSFPGGLKLTKFPEIKGDFMEISLSKEFLRRGFWKDKQRTRLAIYAIVNTAATSYCEGVRFLIDGKPIRNLAHIDLRKPLKKRMDLVIQRRAGRTY